MKPDDDGCGSQLEIVSTILIVSAVLLSGDVHGRLLVELNPGQLLGR
jgi:hypothetical protein